MADGQDENRGMIAGLVAEFRQQFPAYSDKVFFLTGKDDGQEPGTAESIVQSLVAAHHDGLAANKQELYNRIVGMSDLLHVEDFKKGADGVSHDVAIIKGFNADGIRDRKFIQKMLETGGALARYMLDAAKSRIGDRFEQYFVTSIFDHEAGHIVTRSVEARESQKNTYRKSDALSTYCETMADVYSLIRHVQRFGKDTGFLEFMRDFRARTVIQEATPTHYTVRGIEMLIRMKDSENIEGLTPAQTLALAAKISDACIVNGREGHFLKNAFDDASAKKTRNMKPEKLVALIEKLARLSRSNIAMEAASVYIKALDAAVPAQVPELKAAIRKAHDNIQDQRRDPSLPVTLLERIFGVPAHVKKGMSF